jgi:hypothetical protein
MVDMRQLDDVLFHEDHKPRPDIHYGGSKPLHVYEVRPRKDKRGFDLISKALPYGGLWYTQVPDAIEYAQHRSRAQDAVIRVYDAAGNVIETHKVADSCEPYRSRHQRCDRMVSPQLRFHEKY